MIHVKKCPYKGGRGNPVTDFYVNEKPQIYCYGYVNAETDEPIEMCKNCADFVYGKQHEIDWLAHYFEERRKHETC